MDKLEQVEIAEVAGRVRCEGLLATRIRTGQRVGVFDIVVLLHRVPEDDSRLGTGVGIGDDRVPQIAGPQRAMNLAAKTQIEVGVIHDGLHEFMGDEHADIGVLHLRASGVVLDGDKIFDVRMVDAQSQHQRPPPARLGHGVGALRQQIHESRATRRGIDRGIHGGTLGPQNGQIGTDTPARPIDHGRLAQTTVDPLETVLADGNHITVG